MAELAATALFAGELGAGAVAAEGLGTAAVAGIADSAVIGAGGWATSVLPAAVEAAAPAAAAASSGLSLGGTLGALAPLGSLALTGLQANATAQSAMSSLYAGRAAAQSADMQARFVDLDANSALISARQTALAIDRERLIKVGQARVAFAGSGLDVSSAGEIEEGLNHEADLQKALALAGGDAQAAGRRAQAASVRSQGASSLYAAASKASAAQSGLLIDIAKRG